MTYLTDANILSEVTKPLPDRKVLDWLIQNESEVSIDPIILGEIRFGILLLSKGKRRNRLERWFNQGIGKIFCLPWEAKTGLRWAELLADLRRAGKSMPIKDSLIAATALTHDLIVVTRNKDDFKKAGVRVLNPFD
jgi:predicted nucleic acid-binding protein